MCHSEWPVAASSAIKSPSMDPVNTNPPAVASTPVLAGDSSGKVQRTSPVSASIARTSPDASISGVSFSPPPGK